VWASISDKDNGCRSGTLAAWRLNSGSKFGRIGSPETFFRLGEKTQAARALIGHGSQDRLHHRLAS
jgi:hypothetical protein